MYPASEEFHTAVANGAHQIALMIFDSVLDDSKAVFTNDDINVSAGIEFNEYFNTEEDISIGKALSNELSFSVFNDDNSLDTFPFGQFTATLGVQTENGPVPNVIPEYDPTSETYAIIKQPDDAEFYGTETVQFKVIATGVSAYRWQYSANGSSWSNSTLSGYNTATLNISYNETRYANVYRCRLKDANGTNHYTRPVRLVRPGESRTMTFAGVSYTTYSREPYVRRGTSTTSMTKIAPGEPVVSMLGYGDRVYMGLESGDVKAYVASSGNEVSGVELNTFMQNQFSKWNGKGITFGPDTAGGNNMLRIWENRNLRKYEFVPLGVFIAERPNVPTVNEIHLTCYDQMQEFEKDMPDDDVLGGVYTAMYGDTYTYPLPFMKILKAMCAVLNVPICAETLAGFINSDAQIAKRPSEFNSVTMREVLQWLAEAAGSIARFNRDGELKLDWLHQTEQTFDEHSYSEFNPYWYETQTVNALHNRASDGSFNHVVGGGEQGYLIQDNPLLKGVT